MKRCIGFLAFLLVFNACNLDNDPKSESALLYIKSVSMPLQCYVNQQVLIPITYTRPTTCHLFNGFNYQNTSQFTRTVAVEAIKLNESNCIDASLESYTVDLNFKPTEIGIYHFKFLSGIDTSGNFTFLEFDIEAQ